MATELSPWAGLMRPGPQGVAGRAAALQGPGLVVSPVEGIGLVLLCARRGKLAALQTAARALGVDLPLGPNWVASRTTTFLWAGPDQWYMRAAAPFAQIERDWASLLGAAVLIDQSQARAMLTLTGSRVRDVLAKGFEIDLHPRSFAPGQVALAPVAQIPAMIWQIDAAPRYEIAVPRSYAGSFWHWLSESAAEYGCVVETPAEAPTGGRAVEG